MFGYAAGEEEEGSRLLVSEWVMGRNFYKYIARLQTGTVPVVVGVQVRVCRVCHFRTSKTVAVHCFVRSHN